MQADYVQRIRITFSKVGATRFIGHLDLARTLERALNRAQIPVAYTHGFNRRPRMQFASALPLGYTSEAELADIWLTEEREPGQLQQQLMVKMAPGIEISGTETVPLSAPNLQTITQASIYQVTMMDPVDLEALQLRIDQLLAAASWMRERIRKRKKKRYDLRPLIVELAATTTASGKVSLAMTLLQQPAKTGRPDEVLLALELDPLAARIHRVQIVLDA